MNSAYSLLNELIGRQGFTQLTVDELFKGGPLVDVVIEKVNMLDGVNFSERQLEKEVRLMLELLRETLSRRYTRLSVLAFAHVLVALDHFVRVKDKKPDTHIGGYEDDLVVVKRVLDDFRTEISEFKAWKSRLEG